MPPNEQRPGSLRSAAAVRRDDTTSHKWTGCPRHPWYQTAGAILVTGWQAWCPGDGAIAAHWVDQERAA